MKKPYPPCKGCTERVVGCHGSCEIYQRFLTESKLYKKSVYEQTAGGIMADAVAYRTKRNNWKQKHVPGQR